MVHEVVDISNRQDEISLNVLVYISISCMICYDMV